MTEKTEKTTKKTVLKKKAKGYNYKYTDLAGIHEYLEEKNYTYWQEVEELNGEERIITHILNKDDKEIRRAVGCKIIFIALQGKQNATQEYGSGITYARRYSLLMALGLATEDDDAEIMTKGTTTKSSPRIDFTEVRQQIKNAQSMEELMKIYSTIPESLTQYFTTDFTNAKNRIKGE